ncbi:PIN domain-containing protein [Nocardia sp. NPDC058499]|uniref:PIN domain-containing protein n=1 Tax=Nocardia sp. NPDC058499 TaxID=3346530 RepID=UPI00365CACE4
MIILDTNVISETTKKAPDERVTAWLDAQAGETLYLSAVTVGELRYGIATMPAGRHRGIRPPYVGRPRCRARNRRRRRDDCRHGGRRRLNRRHPGPVVVRGRRSSHHRPVASGMIAAMTRHSQSCRFASRKCA